MPGFDWTAWAAPQGIDKASEWVISQPSFFKSFAAMVPKTPLATWKAWMAAQVITMNAPYLSKPFDEARFEFFGKTLCAASSSSGSAGSAACSSSTDPWARRSASSTSQKFFPAASKARMEKMIANLIEAYRQSITEPRLDDAGHAQGSAR